MEDQNTSSFEDSSKDDSALNGDRTPSGKPARSRTRKTRSTTRRTQTQVRETTRASSVPSTFSLGVLLLGLVLAASNLWLMTGQTGSLNGLRESWQSLLGNYGAHRAAKPAPQPAPEPEKPSVKLLYSVANGEDVLPGLQEKLADPIVDYYKMSGAELSAVLIERKQPLSKVVRVRLFFVDGSESEFLWPFTDKASDWWVPPCTLGEPEPDLPACPADFLAKYPQIRQLMNKR